MDRFDRLGVIHAVRYLLIFGGWMKIPKIRAAILGPHLSSRLSFAEHFVSQEGQLIDELSVPDTSAGASLSNGE